MNFKKIVIAVDMEPESLKTLAQIKNFQISKDSEIHLVHIFEFGLSNFDFVPVFNPSEEDFTLIEKIFKEKLVGIKAYLGLGPDDSVTVACRIRRKAAHELITYANEVDADLIVAASQEKAGLKKYFEGSFTNHLTKFSHAHLLILRPEKG